jgi:hypothetical protein
MEGNFKKWEKVLQKILNIIKYIEQWCEEARFSKMGAMETGGASGATDIADFILYTKM